MTMITPSLAASEATGGLDRERIDLLWKIARAGARSAVGTEARRQFRYDGDMNIGVITDFELEVRNALNRRAHAVGAQDVVQHGTEQNNPFPEADEKIFVVSATGESQMLTRGQLKEYIGQQRGEGYVFYENRAYGVAGKSLFDDGLGAAPGVPSGRSKFSPDVLETVPASPGLRRPSLGAVERHCRSTLEDPHQTSLYKKAGSAAAPFTMESVVVGEPGMSEGRRGLGRGLSALLGEVDAAPAQAPGEQLGGSREAPIEILQRNPDQPRRTFREEDLEDLSNSIREKGVLQPILVRPSPDTAGEYQIVASERRWRAAQRAGLKTVPIMVRELDDLAVLEIGIIENVQRADLNVLEEALSYKVLMEKFERTQENIAQTIGKSRSHVANTMRLLALPDEVQSYLVSGELTAGHARAIAAAADPVALAKQIIEGGLSVRETEALARKAPNLSAGKSKGGRPPRVKDTDTQALESDLSSVLGLDVSIDHRGSTGTLTITYATLEQLDDLCNRLTRGI